MQPAFCAVLLHLAANELHGNRLCKAISFSAAYTLLLTTVAMAMAAVTMVICCHGVRCYSLPHD